MMDVGQEKLKEITTRISRSFVKQFNDDPELRLLRFELAMNISISVGLNLLTSSFETIQQYDPKENLKDVLILINKTLSDRVEDMIKDKKHAH